jgi:hypothetical protein
MRTFKFIAALSAIALAIAGCGGGDSKFSTPATGTGGGGGTGGTVTPTAITATASVSSIPSDGTVNAEITAMVRDATNNLLAGVPVTFTASSGGIAVTQGTTDATGAAKATLSTAGDSSLRTITVTVAASGLNATVNVQVVAGSGTSSVQMGSGTGANFQPNIIGISNGTLSAGGSTSLQVVLQQSDGTLYAKPASITFSSACSAQGLATINSPVSTSTGIASATYAAKGCSGSDVITATANVGSSPLSASGSVTVAAASIGSIVFVSASPTNIALKGTGNSQHPESSTIVFTVLDQSTGPRAGATVQFALNTTVGGISLTPATATSDANGRVQTVVTGGTVATSVRVTATVTSTTPTISTQSNLLTVTTGIPDQNSFSLAVLCPNVEALNRDGIPVTVTARLADRFNNPVPDGTAITFTTEGGTIQPQCTTATTQTESGVCAVTWTSSNPRPGAAATGDTRPARSTVLATAIGEESFTDANGNGTFDNGEAFDDVGEAYLDANEDNVYTPGEFIYDFNNNSQRDAPDGIFNGVLCKDTSGRCDASKSTTGIGAQSLIIMSGSTPAGLTGPSAPLHVGASTSQSFSFTFADVNGNPMPQGTTVKADIAGNKYSLGAPTAFTVPCTTEPTTYSFTVIGDVGAVNGTLTLTVQSPAGLETVLQYAITP